MYYFGTNLDSRFAVPDYWPKEHETHKIPFEKEEIQEELKILKQRRLQARERRLGLQARGVSTEHTEHQDAEARNPRPDILEQVRLDGAAQAGMAKEGRESGRGWFDWLK